MNIYEEVALFKAYCKKYNLVPSHADSMSKFMSWYKEVSIND